MTWQLRLVGWLMSCVTRLASSILLCLDRAFPDSSPQHTVRVLSKHGCIERSSPAATISQWPPLVVRLTSTEKRSTTWLLLENINEMLDSRGFLGEESGEETQMWFILSFQEPQRAPLNADAN